MGAPSKQASMLDKKAWKVYFHRKFNEVLINILPVVGHIPPKLRFLAGVVYMLLLFAGFCALFITGYTTARDQSYLSPFSGGSASPNCELVPVENSGIYLASQSGKWQKMKGFIFSEAAYALSLSAYKTNTPKYATLMEDIHGELSAMGERARSQDLAYNLLLWMGWSHVDAVKPANRMFLYGDPLIVFNRDSAVFAVSNATHDCKEPSATSYVASTGVMSTTMTMSTFGANPVCRTIMEPALFGYDTISNPPSFNIEFDVRALSVAMAVNLGMQDLDHLVEVPAFRASVTDSLGQAYTMSRFYDPKFPGMDPVTCILSVSPRVCVFRRGGVAGIPFFHHVGANLTYPTPCNCSTMSPQIQANPSHNCHTFRFIAGFIYWGLPAGTGVVQLLQSLSIRDVQQKSYLPAFIASTFGRSSPLRALFSSPAMRTSAFEFCRVTGIGTCSVATFSTYDITAATFTISPNYLQLSSGACRNSITPNASAWSALVDEPYADLVQSYEECQYSVREILQNQAGITFGNMQIIAPLVVILILLLVIIRQYLCCMPAHFFYNRAEKDGALDDFALALLMTRDGKMDDYGRHHDFSMNINFGSRDPGDGPMPKSNAPFVAGDDIPARKVAPAPSPSFMLGGGARTFTAINARGKRMRASFTSTSIIHNIVVELAMNAKQIATVDNREAVDFIRPAQAEDFVKENVEVIAEEEDGVPVTASVPITAP